MEFSELENVRIKLDRKGTQEFWHRVNEFGGVKNFADAFGISPSKMYNWKAKEAYIPIKLVKKVFGNQASQHVKAYKGGGRSKPVKNPAYPIPENNELLTRINCSVTVNKNGIPLYQASDEGLIRRFNELLQKIGDVPIKLYDRDIYELRYPKYLHKLLMKLDYEQDLDALVDEKGRIENNQVLLNEDKIGVENLGELYHREKRLKLALIRKDNNEIAKLMSEEKEKVKKALK